MPTRLAKANDDNNVWGVINNDYMRTLLGSNEYISIELNGLNPPSINQYTRFQFYNTSTSYTIGSSALTGNNNYPAGYTPTYNISEAIFEDNSSRTFTWGSEGFPSTYVASTPYYFICTGGKDGGSSDIGLGSYALTTIAPTLQINKGGYYTSTGGKALASFITSSGSTSFFGFSVYSVDQNKNIDEKNYFMNSNFEVAQQGTSFSNPASNTYTLD
jgi:hypothetical protein